MWIKRKSEIPSLRRAKQSSTISEMSGPISKTWREAPSHQDNPSADSQEENVNLTPKSPRNWNLQTTQMYLEWDSPQSIQREMQDGIHP
jgi:hypothetical protein